MWPLHDDSHAARPSAGLLGPVPMLLLGAAGMYFLDPQRGRRRRALVRDKLVKGGHCASDSMRRTGQYARDRATGILAETRASMTHDDADDVTICERVRAAIGRAVSHPGAITVTARDGVVTLGGDVLAEECDALFATACGVRGVRDIIDQVDVHEHPGSTPGLQGRPRSRRLRSGATGANWDPLTRLLATAGGTAMTIWGAWRHDTLGLLGSAAGVALAARGLSNTPADKLVGASSGADAVDVQKTMFLEAPLERVFNFFANYQNFPHFMHYVQDVQALDAVRSHWVVAGPMGIKLTWDADLIAYAPGEIIAWRSVPGATVENGGVIRFTEEQRQGRPGTRVDIKLSYNPPAGAIGHYVARLMGSDAKSEMDSDLARVKTMIETGHPPHDAAQPVEGEFVSGSVVSSQ